jgi:bifunctional UDP-N-acetylglucosamine pyrophosphorylase/glucosamine-1-phosphate N-acetyltransferase
MEPLTCNRQLHQIPVAGISIATRLKKLFKCDKNADLIIQADFWPSPTIIKKIANSSENLLVLRKDGSEAVKLICSCSGEYKKIKVDKKSLDLIYPWDILALNEKLVADISKNRKSGDVSDAVNIDGVLHVGKDTVILPGVYIEGKVIIGKNCKIGPNCYIRGNTYIGDNCHIGQAVEIKNSLIMDNVSAGHLSYIGDSVICPHTNLGAGFITANLRHDGKNHKSMVNNQLTDTGRRKMGVIIGDNVHTGIHCSVYPGRKLWPDVCTVPGEIVKYDKKA